MTENTEKELRKALRGCTTEIYSACMGILRDHDLAMEATATTLGFIKARYYEWGKIPYSMDQIVSLANERAFEVRRKNKKPAPKKKQKRGLGSFATYSLLALSVCVFLFCILTLYQVMAHLKILPQIFPESFASWFNDNLFTLFT